MVFVLPAKKKPANGKEINMPLFGRIIEGFRQFTLQKAREESPPRYILAKFEDLGHVPADKLELCLSEIKVAFDTIRDLQAKGLIDAKSARVVVKRIVWIDDGQTEGRMNIGG